MKPGLINDDGYTLAIPVQHIRDNQWHVRSGWGRVGGVNLANVWWTTPGKSPCSMSTIILNVSKLVADAREQIYVHKCT